MIVYNNIKDLPHLVLDVDETLVHCCSEKDEIYKNKDFLLCVINKNFVKYVVYFRPDLFSFLTTASKYYNIHIHSMGTIEYISCIVESIKQKLNFNPFTIVGTRENFINNLKFLHHKIDISKTTIVDDSPKMWEEKYRSLIINIEPFFGPKKREFEYDLSLNKILVKLLKSRICS